MNMYDLSKIVSLVNLFPSQSQQSILPTNWRIDADDIIVRFNTIVEDSVPGRVPMLGADFDNGICTGFRTALVNV